MLANDSKGVDDPGGIALLINMKGMILPSVIDLKLISSYLINLINNSSTIYNKPLS